MNVATPVWLPQGRWAPGLQGGVLSVSTATSSETFKVTLGRGVFASSEPRLSVQDRMVQDDATPGRVMYSTVLSATDLAEAPSLSPFLIASIANLHVI